jgi:hypothetical protein
MIAVAIVALVIAGEQMRRASARYRVQAEYHALREALFRREAEKWHGAQPWVLGGLRGQEALDVTLVPEFAEYHAQMRLKYEHTARYPWLPVEADPPEPGR